MKKTSIKKALSLLVCIVLIAAMALVSSGCKDKNTNLISSEPTAQSQTVVKELGEGKTKFDFEVTDKDGNTEKFVISTDKTIVGDALLELNLIEGDESEYGLYVKKVNGIVADYDVDKTYWAFYINGEMAPTGVDSTEITAGVTYAFVVSK